MRSEAVAPAGEDPERQADRERRVTTAASVRPSVSMLRSHRPRTPNERNPVAPRSASRQPPMARPSAAAHGDEAGPGQRVQSADEDVDQPADALPDRSDQRDRVAVVRRPTRGAH